MGTEKTTAPATTKKPPAKPAPAPAPQNQTGPARPPATAPAQQAAPAKAAGPAKAAEPAKAPAAAASPTKAAEPAKAAAPAGPAKAAAGPAKPSPDALPSAMRAVRAPAQTPEKRAEAVHRLHRTVGGRQASQLARKHVGAAPSAAGHSKDHPTPGAPDLKVSKPDDPAEKHAEQVARTVASGGKAPAQPGTEPAKAATLHRAMAPHPGPEPIPAQEPAKTPEPAHDLGAELASPDQGTPIPQPTLGILEHRMGADLGHVRVHQGAQADKLARQIQARAFTKGNDVYLAADASPNDVELMAHEATHVLQAHPTTLHRAANVPNAAAKPGAISGNTMTLDLISVPSFKREFTKKQTPLRSLPKPKDKRDTNQIAAWTKVAKDGIANNSKLVESLHKGDQPLEEGGKQVFYLRVRKSGIFVLGDLDTVIGQLARPVWDSDGNAVELQVDHKLEYQLGGRDDKPDDNLWLLEQRANGSAGSRIEKELDQRVEALLDYERGRPGGPTGIPKSAVPARNKYNLEISDVDGKLGFVGQPNQNWSLTKIKRLKQLEQLEPLSASQVKTAGLKGSATSLAILLPTVAGGGGQVKHIPWGATGTVQSVNVPGFFGPTPFEMKSVMFEPGKGGEIRGYGYRNSKLIRTGGLLPLRFDPHPGIEWGGVMSTSAVAQMISRLLSARGLSPIEFEDVGFSATDGLTGRGRLIPTVPLFDKLGIELRLAGDDLWFERTFDGGELAVPSPFKVTASTLTLSAGSRGLGASGEVRFEVERLGKGSLGGSASTDRGLGLKGQFDFENTPFKPAHIEVSYAKNGDQYEFAAAGTLGIDDKVVKGVRSANIKAAYAQGKLTAAGTAELAIPGLRAGSLDVAYAEREGLTIGGSFELAKDIPGVKGGTLAATVHRSPEGGWSLAGSGTIEPAIPGVESQLAISYHDGIFDASAQVAYAKGMLAGQLMLGVTNRSVGEDGKPGEKPAGKLTVYGAGQLTVQLAPWLTGTVGVQVKPDGGVKVAGKVALKDGLTLFGEKSVDKELLKIGVDIPIVGVAVAGQRIGIFATIQGALQAKAGVGPGELRQLSVEVQYDPAHEDQTQITGKAQLYVPAHAGLRLAVRGAVGAGIPVVSVEAGLEIAGELGIQGAAEATVEVNWSPAKGLDVQAEAYVHAEPVFKFDLTGYVLVEADLWITTIELYSKRWKLASFEYGPGLHLGVRVPVHHQEGKPFDLALSDVKFEIPPVDPMKVISDLVHKIA